MLKPASESPKPSEFTKIEHADTAPELDFENSMIDETLIKDSLLYKVPLAEAEARLEVSQFHLKNKNNEMDQFTKIEMNGLQIALLLKCSKSSASSTNEVIEWFDQ